MIQIKIGNCRKLLKEIPRKSVQSTITSPPYYGLRDYGEDDQIGLEETPEEYVANLVEVFREVRETLADDGTLWLNLGDSYYNYRPSVGKSYPKQTVSKTDQDLPSVSAKRNNKLKNLKEKDLIGIPWMVAFALRNDGWYLRQDIIWSKPNPMPESVVDRCTKSHEYIFLLSKNRNYYYDNEAIKEEATDWGTRDRTNGKYHNEGSGLSPQTGLTKSYATRNKRSVWRVNPANLKDAHFATFPEKLILPMVLATTIPGETILDPFAGSGTTGLVAGKHNRSAILIELNPDYKKIIDKRLEGDLFFSAETEGK